jgi:photosystem II stability/assembly factor-like uncharacterized protein
VKISALVLAVVAATANAASWSKPSSDIAGEIIAGGMSSKGEGFMVGGSTGIGAQIFKSTDFGSTWEAKVAPTSFMLVAAGVSKTTENSAVINDVLAGTSYTTDGNNFTKSAGGGGESQSVEAFGLGCYGVTGAFGPGGSGVAISNDGGATFTNFPIPADVLDGNHPARYGAFPSATTWYVSAGSWPSNSHLFGRDEGSKLVKQLSESIQLRQSLSTGKVFPRWTAGVRNLGNITGYHGAIAKTVDGGKTWTKVFQQDDYFYFNGIHCSSETSCIAVAEGHNCAKPGAHIFTTTDGGKTWTQTMSDPGSNSGLFGARMVSATEGWAAGGGASSTGMMEGRFWHTMDGGKTWSKEPLAGCMAMGIDCSDKGHCVSPAVSQMQQGTIATYK